MPVPRNHLGTLALDGKAYVIGGQLGENETGSNQTRVDVYGPSTGAWITAAPVPRPLGHITASTFVLDGRIVIAGGVTTGKKDLADLLSYDPAADVWVALRPLPKALKSTVAGQVNGRMMVSTGSGATFGDSSTWTATLAGTWVGEVAGGVIRNRLYLVGEGSGATLAYDLSTNAWTSTTALPRRPFKGHHHAAETINGKLYLFGGLGSGADGKVQMFDPAANAWTLGAPLPWAGGSVSTAVINGKVYAAAATDGRRFYVFGGRSGANVVSNGFDTVQVYDPATNAWTTSLAARSSLAPLPVARGGMGKAVFHSGEFHIFGGETQTARARPPTGYMTA